jgi:hypothetical protein
MTLDVSTSTDTATLVSLARGLDREERLAEAACVYEAVVRSAAPELDLCLNLAVLYLASMDPVEAAHHGLGDSFRAFAKLRFHELIDEIEGRWPKSVEAWFWKRYALRLYDSGAVFVRECEERLRGSSELVPYAYLHLAGGKDHQQQVRALRVLGTVQLTTRMRYVLSMLG